MTDTINPTPAHTSANTTWKESTNTEPLSGASGDVTKGEPFDAGNMEPQDQERLQRSMDSGLNDDANYTTTKASASDEALSPSTLGGSSAKPEEDTEEVDVTGPGPRALDEVARENGGDAGQSSDTTSTSTGQKSAGLQPDGPLDESSSHEEGTGEQWVKTSGLAADGGDFDATKPGAGREADRLMEQKGMKIGDDGQAQPDASAGGRSNSDSSDKPGIIDRLKDKLHKH